MSSKKMSILTLCIVLCALILVGGMTVFFDPLFHYHEPFAFQRYDLVDQRYQNDGIARNFEYDAIITGTSMTENFKTSEFDTLFHANSVKIPYFGASFKELDEAVSLAIARNDKLTLVLRSLDHYKLFEDKDTMSYSDYPSYLYDDTLLNDVNYLLNKDILLTRTYANAMMTLKQQDSTSFDTYSNWNASAVYGKSALLQTYTRQSPSAHESLLSDDERENIRQTVLQNFIQTAQEAPNVDFIFFLPPYSILYWDSLYIEGTIKKHLEAQELAIRMLLEQDNIHIYSFANDYETVCNLDCYKDTLHYSEEINSKILVDISNGAYQVTKENCEQYFSEVYDYYTTYDYDALFHESE